MPSDSVVPISGLVVDVPAKRLKTVRKALDSVDWSTNPRRHIPGDGFCVGATQNHKGPYLQLPTNHCRRNAVRTMNAPIRDLGVPPFCWSSLQFNSNTVASPHADRNNVGAWQACSQQDPRLVRHHRRAQARVLRCLGDKATFFLEATFGRRQFAPQGDRLDLMAASDQGYAAHI